MNRSETVEAIANIERELRDASAQDTLVVLARQLQMLAAEVERHDLPNAKVIDLGNEVNRRLTPESRTRVAEGVLPLPQRARPTQSSEPTPTDPAPAPCEHRNKSFNDEGLPVCNDCGHVFTPPATKPTIDRKAAINDLFGGN